jgi:hypothetical protein
MSEAAAELRRRTDAERRQMDEDRDRLAGVLGGGLGSRAGASPRHGSGSKPAAAAAAEAAPYGEYGRFLNVRARRGDGGTLSDGHPERQRTLLRSARQMGDWGLALSLVAQNPNVLAQLSLTPPLAVGGLPLGGGGNGNHAAALSARLTTAGALFAPATGVSALTAQPMTSDVTSRAIEALAEAAGACAAAMDLEMMPTPSVAAESFAPPSLAFTTTKENSNSATPNLETAGSDDTDLNSLSLPVGPVTALDSLTQTVESMLTTSAAVAAAAAASPTSPNTAGSVEEARRAAHQREEEAHLLSVIRASFPAILSFAAALRRAGGIDLLLQLDSGLVGATLRRACHNTNTSAAQQQQEMPPPFLELQRWHHEIIAAFDACGDWQAAVDFFTAHASRPVATSHASSSKTETDGHGADPAAAAAADLSSLATSAKPEASATTTADAASAAVRSQPSAVATFGAVTVAVLVELAQREGQSMVIQDLIRQRLVGPAEARALARAYARLIDMWNASTTVSQQRLRDQRMYQSSFGAGAGGEFGSPSFSFAPPRR